MNICKRTIIMEVLGHAEIVPRFFSGPFFAVARSRKLANLLARPSRFVDWKNLACALALVWK